MFRSRSSTRSAPLRFEGRSVQLLAAWTLAIAGAASTAQVLTKPRQGSAPTGLNSPNPTPSTLLLSVARAPRR